MPNKKKTVLQREEELAQRIMEEVNTGIEARFEKFERIMERMAAVAAPPSPDNTEPRNTKRPADQTPSQEAPPQKVSRTIPNIDSQPPSHSALSTIDHVPDVDPEQTLGSSQRQSQQATPRHPNVRFAEPWNAAAHVSNHNQMSTNHGTRAGAPRQANTDVSDSWQAWSTAHNTTSLSNNRQGGLPTSTHDTVYTDSLDSQVKQILASTVHNLGKGNAQPFDFPFKYILRGPEKVKATINSVTLPEHLWGIFRIMHDPKTDIDIKPALMIHIEQIVEDAQEYDWESGVRRWSEEVFSRISEGRLINGWHAYDEIQRMRMVIAQSKPIIPKQSQTHYKDNFNKKHLSQPQSQFDINKGGPPCSDYNSPTGCTLNSGHIKQGKRQIHVCSFCLHNTSTANNHPETYCRNKVRLTGSNNHFQ